MSVERIGLHRLFNAATGRERTTLVRSHAAAPACHVQSHHAMVADGASAPKRKASRIRNPLLTFSRSPAPALFPSPATATYSAPAWERPHTCSDWPTLLLRLLIHACLSLHVRAPENPRQVRQTGSVVSVGVGWPRRTTFVEPSTLTPAPRL